VPRRQEDHRDLVAVRAEPPADLESVQVGQHDVQQDEVGAFAGGRAQGLLAGVRGHGREAVEAQRDLDQVADVGLVVDDEDAPPLAHARPSLMPGPRSCPDARSLRRACPVAPAGLGSRRPLPRILPGMVPSWGSRLKRYGVGGDPLRKYRLPLWRTSHQSWARTSLAVRVPPDRSPATRTSSPLARSLRAASLWFL